MKITTGIDIIEVDRIEKAIEELGTNFLNRIYTENEIKYCNNTKKMKYQHYAARFVVKEAVFKAISEYIGGRTDDLWKDIEVINKKSGKPAINVERLRENLRKNADKEIKIQDIDISISHIDKYAIANVVVVLDN